MAAALALLELVALVGGEVHSMVPGEAARQATLLIEDGRVRALGADLEVPDGATVVDARGLHLIPGLIDGFAYHDPDHDALYTAAGVTLVRDHGNDLTRIFGLAALQRRDAAAGPALSICGAVIDGEPPSTTQALSVGEPAEANHVVERLREEGVDFLAIQQQLGEPAWRRIVEKAHEEGREPLQVWGPVPEALDLAAVAAGGQDGLLFLDAFLPQGRGWDQVEPAELEPAVEAVRSGGMAVTPLVRGLLRSLESQDPRSPDFRLLDPRYEAIWTRDRAARAGLLDAERLERGREAVANQQALLRRLDAAGVPLVPGSGAPHPWLMPGRGLAEELRAWVAAGLPAARVLELATVGAARTLGLEGRGTLEPGKVADVVALRGDPTQDLAALHEVAFVVLRGRVLGRAELDEHVEQVAARQARARVLAAEPIEVAPPALPKGAPLLAGYVETVSEGARLSAERWAIVRQHDGGLAFVGRKRIPGAPGDAPIEVEVRQDWRERRLDSFEVRVRSAGHELVARGLTVAGQMRVERRIDGAFVDNQIARETLAAIDAGSVTTFMLIAHTRPEPGPLPVLRLHEGLELEVVRWTLALEEDADHWLRTPSGGKFAAFASNGALKAALEVLGSSAVVTTSEQVDAFGGPGLPLPAGKRERVLAAEAALEASEAAAREAAARGGERGGSGD